MVTHSRSIWLAHRCSGSTSSKHVARYSHPVLVYALVAVLMSATQLFASTERHQDVVAENRADSIRVSPGPKAVTRVVTVDSSDDDAQGLRIDGSGASFRMGMQFSLLEHPSIEVSAGTANWSCKDVTPNPQTMGVIQISSGTLSLKPLRQYPSVARAEYDRFFVQLYDPEYRGALDTTQLWMKGWRFGFHLTGGYSTVSTSNEQDPGWVGKREARKPGWSLLHTGGLVWSYNTFDNLDRAVRDSTVKGIYRDIESYRFGTHTGAMVRYDLTSALSLSVEVERTMMFRDYSFFGWAGSAMVEGLAQSILTGSVIRSIERKSPGSVAVAALFLRTALSYGMYEIRRGGQHFPFSGNKPMISDAIRLGFGFSF